MADILCSGIVERVCTRFAHTDTRSIHSSHPRRQAESRSNPRSSGLVINQATSVTYAGDQYPAPRSSSGTQNAQQRSRLLVKSGQMGLPMNTFGTVAQATVDTNTALCVAFFTGWQDGNSSLLHCR